MRNSSGVDMDFGVWPLWCGSANVIVDERLARQLAAHLCVLACDSDEFKQMQDLLLPFARGSHRAKDLGI